MRILTPKEQCVTSHRGSFFSEDVVAKFEGVKTDVIKHYYKEFYISKQEVYYNAIGDILRRIGFKHVSVSRGGDTNIRMDAVIIDSISSVPIEIKSPTEVEYINIKAISQALENKIILQSRKFYASNMYVTSLVIAHNYPNDRSEVKNLMDFYVNSYDVIIGCIDFRTLLSILFDIEILQVEYNLDSITYLKGFLDA